MRRIRHGIVDRKLGVRTFPQSLGDRPHSWWIERWIGRRGGGRNDATRARSDTGGSIRQPAALCGIVGLKPTYGRVSRYGLIAFASSLDQIGPFARTVEDAARLLEAISGHDPHDATSARTDAPAFSQRLGGGASGLRVGVPRRLLAEGVDGSVLDAFDKSLDVLQQLGATIQPVSCRSAALRFRSIT